MIRKLARTIIEAIHDLEFKIEIHKISLKRFDSQKTVVIFSHDISLTGAPLLASKISEQMKKDGYSTIIASMNKSSESKFMEKSCDLLIENKVNIKNVVYLIRKLNRSGINKAICNTVVTGEFTQILNQYEFNVISLIHEMRSSTEILQAEKMIESISENANTLIFPAQCVLDDFVSWEYKIKGKAIILPQGNYKETNGIVVSEHYRQKLISTLKVEQNAIFFIGVGSINFGKGVDLIPLIAEKMIKKEKDFGVVFHFIWLGSSNSQSGYEIWLKNQIHKMGLENRIHFLGHLENETDYFEKLAGCTAFVLLSREDSMPTVLFESISIRLPVVAFKENGGAEELLSEGRGYLVDYMDIDAYCDTMFKMIKNEDIRNITTQKAQIEIKSKYSFSNYVKTILERLNSLG